MKRISIFVAVGLAIATTSLPALAADAATVAVSAKYTTKTTPMNTLLADPAAKAVLAKHVPQLIANADVAERAGGMTLSEIAEAIKAYSPDMLTEAVMAKIDTDLAALPAH